MSEQNVSYGGLPPEYQAQLEAAQRRRAMAMALQQQALQPVTPQSKGRIQARTPAIAPLLQALTGYMANRTASGADEEIAKVRGRYDTQSQEELAALQGLPEDEAIKKGRVSRNPIARALAEQLQKQRDKRLELYVGAVKDPDPNLAAGAARTGVIPDTPIAPPAGPEFGQEGENRYAITTNRKGEKGIHFAPFKPAPGASVNVRLPGDEARASLDILQGELKERRERAVAAKESLRSINNGINAINEGAQSGGLEGVKQSIRKVAQGLGIPDANTAPTEKLQMALGQQVLAHARKLAPVTEVDIRQLELMLGSVNTDPMALRDMMTKVQSISKRELDDYNKWIEVQGSNLQTPYASDMFRGAKIGFEPPTELPKPKASSGRLIWDGTKLVPEK